MSLLKKSKLAMTGAIIALLMACGGGASNTDATQKNTSENFTASASVGEVLKFTIDTSNLTYSYTTLRSDYGCDIATSACFSKSGTLFVNSNGTYQSTSSNANGPNINFRKNADGLIVGSMALNVTGDEYFYTPIIGLSNPIKKSSNLAGVYNYVAQRCSTKSAGRVSQNCVSKYGILTIYPGSGDTTASFNNCTNATVNDSNTPLTNNCSSEYSGVLSLGANGIWVDSDNGLSLAAYTNSQGKTTGFVDVSSNTYSVYGQWVFSSQDVIIPTTVYRDYFGASLGTSLFSANWTIDASGASYVTSAGFRSGTQNVSYNDTRSGISKVPLGPFIFADGLFVIAGQGGQFVFGY